MEDCINKACDAIYDSRYSNCTQVTKMYQCSLCHLQRRWNRIASKSKQVATNKIFTEAKERAICKYINCLDKKNICAYLKMIMKFANYFTCFKN